MLSLCVGTKSTHIWLKYRLKAAICLSESFPCHLVALVARIRKDRVNRNLNRFDGPPAPKHMVLLGQDNSQQSPTITRPLSIWEGKQHNTHNFMKVEVHTLYWMFFCDSNPFRIFFNWEIETCGWYPHLVTSSYIKNDENMTNGYTTQQLRIVRILAYTTLTLLYIECRFMVELKLATRIQKQWSHPLIQMLSKNRALRNLYAKYYRFHRWVLSSFRILKTGHIETPFWCSKVIIAR